MEKLILSKCGNICSLCPWSREVRQNISEKEWEEYATQVKKYIGFTPPKIDWEGCLGCHTPDDELDDNPHYNYIRGCTTRKCVMYNGIGSCVYCTEFPCSQSATTKNYSKENITQKLGNDISNTDFEMYVKAFDSFTNLKKIRDTISSDLLVKPKIPEKEKIKISPFPRIISNINGSKFKVLYNNLHKIINSDLGAENTNTLVGYEYYKKQLDTVFRFLWIFGNYGQIIENMSVSLDSISIYQHKKRSKIPTHMSEWVALFDILKNFGIIGSIKSRTDDLLTPTGWMREKIPDSTEPAFYVELEFGNKIEGLDFFITLQTYITELNQNYGKRPYGFFKKLDMSFLSH